MLEHTLASITCLVCEALNSEVNILYSISEVKTVLNQNSSEKTV